MSRWPKEEEIRASSSTDGRMKVSGETKRGRETRAGQKMRNLRKMRGAYALFEAWYARGVDQSRCPLAEGAVKGNEALTSVGFGDRMTKHLDGIWTAPLGFRSTPRARCPLVAP